MAFNDKELEIIRYGVQNGKSRQDVEQALANYRTGVTPQKPTQTAQQSPSYIDQVGQAAQAGFEKVKEGLQTPEERNPIRAIEGGLKVGAGAIEAAASPLAPLFSPIGKLIGYVSDKIGDNKAVQDFAMSPAGETTARIAEDVGNAATITGTVAGGMAAPKVGQTVVSKLDDAAGTATRTVQGAVETATKPLSAARSWVQQPVKANVQTVLKETPTAKFDQYVDLARKATQNSKNATPLEFAGTRAQEALDNIQTKLSAAGKTKRELMNYQGISGFQGNGIKTFRQGLESFLNSKTTVEGDTRLIRDIKAQFNALGETPSVGQVDRFIDFAQDRIYTGGRDLTVPITDETTAALRTLVGKLNSELKKQVSPELRSLNDRYSKLIDIRNELNTKLGKEGEKGGALLKRVFSPSDANTKKLFAEVLDETGIDLVNEATLARYVMDILGDARQKSMLEQLNISVGKPTASSISGRIIDYLIEQANSPEELIQRARALTSGSAPAP